MAVIFSDSFTDTDGVALQSHTPTVGTSWTKLWESAATKNFTINTNTIITSLNSTHGVVYQANCTYTSENYYVQAKFVAYAGGNSMYLFLRMTDIDNLYAFYTFLDPNTANGSQIYAKLSGTWYPISSTFTSPALNNVVKFEVAGSRLRVYYNTIHKMTVYDNKLTATGVGGLGGGGGSELVTSGDGLDQQSFDDFEIGEGTSSTLWKPNRMRPAIFSPGIAR